MQLSGKWPGCEGKFRKRERSLSSAYNNYCRSIDFKLYLAKSFKITFFGRWAAVRKQKWKLDDRTLEHLWWNGDNMKHFVNEHVTLEAYHEHRQQEYVARRRPSHRLSNRRMPMELSPNLIQMLGLTLAAQHSESYLGLTSVSPSSHVALPKLRRLQPAIIYILLRETKTKLLKAKLNLIPKKTQSKLK